MSSKPVTGSTGPGGKIKKTRFAFLITDITDEIKLTIYTASGKVVRTWSLSNIIGYQEIEWDGRDKDGYKIANGTYYVKLTARKGSKKVKKIIRIAKLEGY
jgi:flagellar hook assembly protein FlgD